MFQHGVERKCVGPEALHVLSKTNPCSLHVVLNGSYLYGME